MAAWRAGRRQQSLWSRSGPNARLLFGIAVIAIIGLLGLTPKTLFGVDLIWPHAALWGAVGWGRVGLSLRPMLALVIFGVLQDFAFYAPVGSFALVNLGVYGLSAALTQSYDTDADPLLRWMAPPVLILAGFMGLFLIASSIADHAVRLSPLMRAYAVTTLLYLITRPLFALGRRPGKPQGAPA